MKLFSRACEQARAVPPGDERAAVSRWLRAHDYCVVRQWRDADPFNRSARYTYLPPGDSAGRVSVASLASVRLTGGPLPSLGTVIETIIPSAVKRRVGLGYTQKVRLAEDA